MNAVAPRPDHFELEERYQEALERARAFSTTLEGPSIIERLARLPRHTREDILSQFPTSELARIWWEWSVWARPKQRPDLAAIAHRILFLMGGRGSGKSRSAEERVRDRIYAGARRIGILGANIGDVEKYMLGVDEEEMGLFNVFHPKHRPEYVGRPHYLVHFHTGAIGFVVGAETPEFRGSNLDTAWCDEIIKWRYLAQIWTNLELSTRVRGVLPVEILVTSTPWEMRFLKELIADPDTVTILSKMVENLSNVDPRWVASMQKKYGGTRVGRRELDGEMPEDLGKLFWQSVIEDDAVSSVPGGLRTAISVDPAIATEPKNDETGIVGLGEDGAGELYVLSDKSGRHKPEAWGRIVVDEYDRLKAEAVVGERNRGGDLVEANVRAAMFKKRGQIAADALNYVDVHATKGKAIRAEPVSSLHEQHRIHFVRGAELHDLTDEITEWDPSLGGPSPNRLDALVWGVWYLGNLGDTAKPDYRATAKGLGAITAAASKAASRIPSRPLATPARTPYTSRPALSPKRTI